jgi:hypothetical protein
MKFFYFISAALAANKLRWESNEDATVKGRLKPADLTEKKS